MSRRRLAQGSRSRKTGVIVSAGTSSGTNSRLAQLERGDGIVQAIDPVLAAIFRMVAHPADELCRNVAGGKLHNARVQKLAFRQKFDVSKDLLLARFGSSLAV